jgi:hypothetical protein
MNNNWWCENIRATNPCGEQPLPPYGSCLLGSVNLTTFVRDPFGPKARFDWDEYREVVRVFTRMLDNVVEINGLPLEQQRNEILSKRRHGMGFLGLGSTITCLGMKYGAEDSIKFTEDVSREMAVAGWEAALDLAKEKGPARSLSRGLLVTSAQGSSAAGDVDDPVRLLVVEEGHPPRLRLAGRRAGWKCAIVVGVDLPRFAHVLADHVSVIFGIAGRLGRRRRQLILLSHCRRSNYAGGHQAGTQQDQFPHCHSPF